MDYFVIVLNKTCLEYKALFLNESEALSYLESKDEHWSCIRMTPQEVHKSFMWSRDGETPAHPQHT